MTELHTERAKRERRRVDGRVEADFHAAYPNARILDCAVCGADLWYSGRGFQPKWCDQCRPTGAERAAEYRRQHPDKFKAGQRDYRERHRDEKAAYDRARYEENKERIKEQARRRYAEKRQQIRAQQNSHRAYAGKCEVCGEHLREMSTTGLCGFCEEERL